MPLRVLHIDSGLSWRGGQKQLNTLLNHLPDHQVESYVVIPKAALHEGRFLRAKEVLTKPMGALSQFTTAVKLVRFCITHRIDILHAHTSKAHTIAMILNRLLPRSLPLVVHRHVVFKPSGFLLQRLKYSSKVVSKFVAISDAVKKALVAYGVPESLITTIKTSYVGRHIEQEDKRIPKQRLCRSIGLDHQKLLIGFCGALTEEKGCFDLLKAIDLLRRSSGETPQVVFAGSGHLKDKILAEIHRLKMQDKVILLGFVEDTETFFQAIDILVFPSTSEGLGLTLLEAAFGLCAVVASKVGGISEVVAHEHSGILVPPRAPREIARALTHLMSNPLLRLKYAVNLRAHVKKHFSPLRMSQECAALYRSLRRPGEKESDEPTPLGPRS